MLQPRSTCALLALALALVQPGCGADDAESQSQTVAEGPATSAADGVGGAGGAAVGAGGAGAGFVPEPIPDVGEELPPPCPDTTPSGSFQFLDDTCGVKVWPSLVDRQLACPVSDDSAEVPLTGGGTASYAPSDQPIVVEEVLGGVVPAELFVTVILVRRVGGRPHYRYLSNGSHDVAYQPWSTSKLLAAANAGARLREASSDAVGLTASVGTTPLGDLVTSVHNYDWDPYSSNALGRYFHDIGGRARANELIHGLWLGRPASETFGGNYGAASPPLGYTFSEQGGPSITISPDTTSGPANNLSSYTMAEAIKRLVLHREEPDQRMPGIQYGDIATLLYGAEGSTKYGDWGGMSADTTVYFQTGHDIDYLERRSQGRWRIFSKLGLGSGGQFLDVGYACLPVLDDALMPVSGWGRELLIAAALPTGGSSWVERDRMLAQAFRSIMVRVIDGRL